MPHIRLLQRSETDDLGPDETAVVVDVLRATSTVAVALRQGALGVHPVLSPEDAHERAAALEAQGHEVTLVGERARGALEGFVDNSPATIAKMDLSDQEVVMTTTNGTKALLACPTAGRVVAGGLVNAQRLVDALSGGDVAVVASGWMGRATRDDDACCEYLAARLQGQEPSLEETLARIEESTSATKLREHGKGADVDLCLSLDAAPVLPVLGEDGALRAA